MNGMGATESSFAAHCSSCRSSSLWAMRKICHVGSTGVWKRRITFESVLT